MLQRLAALWRRPPADPTRAAPAWIKREAAMMGTAVSVELWADDPQQGQAAAEAVMAEMARIERCMSPHLDSSELSRINREAAWRPVALSEEMAGLIERSLALSVLSGGAFDISFASAGQLYDYRQGVAPDPAALAQACQAIGYPGLLLDRAARTLRFARPGMRIDLGGVAKGHAVDCCVALLRQRGIAHAMVAAGGDSHLLGDRRGRPWTIAIRDPRRADAVVAVLPLENVAIATSGDYERFFERDGVRHHHVLNPRTGRSPDGVRAVTILADDGVSAEGLSKTVFVQGVGPGLALIESLPGVDAVVVDSHGRLHCSSGLLQPARPGIQEISA